MSAIDWQAGKVDMKAEQRTDGSVVISGKPQSASQPAADFTSTIARGDDGGFEVVITPKQPTT